MTSVWHWPVSKRRREYVRDETLNVPSYQNRSTDEFTAIIVIKGI